LHTIVDKQSDVDKETDDYGLFTVGSPGKVTPWNAVVDIEGVTVSMQLDTGATLSHV